LIVRWKRTNTQGYGEAVFDLRTCQFLTPKIYPKARYVNFFYDLESRRYLLLRWKFMRDKLYPHLISWEIIEVRPDGSVIHSPQVQIRLKTLRVRNKILKSFVRMIPSKPFAPALAPTKIQFTRDELDHLLIRLRAKGVRI